ALSLAMRRDERLGQTPIILASNSYGDAADQALAERAGASALVPRTPELREVVAALRTLSPPPARVQVSRKDDAELERQRMQSVTRQLERQVALYAGASQRAAL